MFAKHKKPYFFPRGCVNAASWVPTDCLRKFQATSRREFCTEDHIWILNDCWYNQQSCLSNWAILWVMHSKAHEFTNLLYSILVGKSTKLQAATFQLLGRQATASHLCLIGTAPNSSSIIEPSKPRRPRPLLCVHIGGCQGECPMRGSVAKLPKLTAENDNIAKKG